MQDLEILEFSHPLIWTEDQSKNVSLDGARMLPPKLYLVVFLSSEPSELDKDNLFGL